MYIYKITNTKNGKCYIGQSVQSNNKRLTNHRYRLNKGTHPNKHLQAAWDLYGADGFLFEKIAYATTVEELDTLERDLIQEHQSDNRDFGYNIFNGGHHQHNVPDETKQKIGNANRGNLHTEHQRQTWAVQKRTNVYPDKIVSPDGTIYTVDNIRDFCKTHKIDRGNFIRVLKGIAYHTKGWRLPNTPIEFCDRRYLGLHTQLSKSQGKTLISPEGVPHVLNKPLSVFCEEHNLMPNKIRAVLTKKQKHHKGWKLYE